MPSKSNYEIYTTVSATLTWMQMDDVNSASVRDADDSSMPN